MTAAQLQTEASVGGQQRITSHLWVHLAVTQDEVRQDREHRLACGALDTPDSETTQPKPEVMRMTRQAPSAATAHLMFELKAQGQEESHDAFDKRLAVAKELNVGGFVVKIDRDGSVFAGLASSVSHGSPSGQMVVATDDPRWG
ncbi:MAG TPA: hypothetical protein VE844_01230 [Gammaproteobacteria bacterium]|nr:hypothetical protein [Gammaproteobacteria bacterium]